MLSVTPALQSPGATWWLKGAPPTQISSSCLTDTSGSCYTVCHVRLNKNMRQKDAIDLTCACPHVHITTTTTPSSSTLASVKSSVRRGDQLCLKMLAPWDRCCQHTQGLLIYNPALFRAWFLQWVPGNLQKSPPKPCRNTNACTKLAYDVCWGAAGAFIMHLPWCLMSPQSWIITKHLASPVYFLPWGFTCIWMKVGHLN